MAKKKKASKKKVSKKKELDVLDQLAKDLRKECSSIEVMSGNHKDQVPYVLPLDHIGLDIITGGVPGGRFVQVEGDSQIGKSYVLYEIMGSCIRQGGYCFLADPEVAYEPSYGRKVGIDEKARFLYSKDRSLEKFFTTSRKFVKRIRAIDKDCPIVIGMDSYPPMMPKVTVDELEKADKEAVKGYVHAKKNATLAALLGDFIGFIDEHKVSLVFINQGREKMNVSFGDAYTSNGENVIKFYLTWRLRGKLIRKIKKEVNGKKKITGVEVEWSVSKSRRTHSFQNVVTEIDFDKGCDKYSGLYNLLLQTGIVKKCKVGNTNGFEYKGKQFKRTEVQKFIEKRAKLLARLKE